MPKPLITFMFKGLGNGLLRKLFFSLSVDLLFEFFPLSGDCFFVCEEWNIFSIEGALLFNSGRIFCQLRKDVFWIEKGSIIILRNDIIVFFYRGFVFVERGFIWFTGIFFERGFIFSDVFLLDEYIGGKRLHHYIQHSKSSHPSPFYRQPSGCKASWVQGIARMEDSRWNGWNCSWQWKGLKTFHELLSISHEKNQ